jgi:ribose transport system ATP-binding protein
MNNNIILKMQNIVMQFPGVKALDNVDFYLREQEVLALVGENGAGKSTLIKILSGVYSPDSGTVNINNKDVIIKDPKTALELGISTIYQETSLVPELTIAENIFLGREKTKFFKINWKELYNDTKKILSDLSMELSPYEIIGDLSSSRQQLVEIAKAFSHNSKIIIMDEPTASITEIEKEYLFSLIKKVIKNGTSVIYISHRLKEIFEIANRVFVLRDGKHVFDTSIRDTNEDELIQYMIGKSIGDIYGNKNYKAEEKSILCVKNLTKKGVFSNVSFDLKEGEILGFSGLVGSGRSEIMRCVFGIDNFDAGKIILNGVEIVNHSPYEAIKNGFAFVSEDRRIESIIQDFSVRENLSLLLLSKITNKFGMIRKKYEKILSKSLVKKFNIKTSSIEQLIKFLSGGNQQKVALAKVLPINPKILILDEPTKGIDVGAKKEIHDLIRELTIKGVSVILISSELPEILGMCHRVVVIKGGELMAIFNKSEMTEELLLNSAFGLLKKG